MWKLIQLRCYVVTFLMRKPVSLSWKKLNPRDASYWPYFLPLTSVKTKQRRWKSYPQPLLSTGQQLVGVPKHSFSYPYTYTPVFPAPTQAPPPATHPCRSLSHSVTYLYGHKPSACHLPLLHTPLLQGPSALSRQFSF